MTAHDSPFLVRSLWRRAEEAPDAIAIVLVAEDGTKHEIRASDLRRGAGRSAGALRRAGVAQGDPVLVALGHSRELVDAIVGVLALGAVPAVAPYLAGRLDPGAHATRVARMARALEARAVLAEGSFAAALRAELGGDGHEAACTLVTGAELVAFQGGEPPLAPVADEALAYLQFTSGSTGAQKIVAHTQRAMREYLTSKISVDRYDASDVIVTWLPLYHDLGLVSGLLTPLVAGIATVLMSPAHWVRDPKILLHAVHEYGGTYTWMPNFALSHSTRAIRDRDLEGVSLRTWKKVVLGGEMVRHEGIRAFVERFAPYGLDPGAVKAAYGMAENIEGIAAAAHEQWVDWISRSELQRSGRAVPVAAHAPDATAVVSCGRALPGTEFRVTDADGRDVPERTIGEIVARSAYCMTGGYYRRPDLTAAAFRDGWFLTGDLGYVAGGTLYPCGRKKDLVIVGGHNIYPDDAESIAGDVPGVAAGRVVAFGVPDERMGTERLVIVCELREAAATGEPGAAVAVERNARVTGEPEAGVAGERQALNADVRREIEAEIRRRIVGHLDVAVGEIRFVERGWILKTSSGKLARSANRDKLAAERSAQTTAAAHTRATVKGPS